MVVAFQKAGAKVLLAGITLPRNYGPDYIRDFERVYSDLAAKYKAALCAFPAGRRGHRPSVDAADRLHPTAEGNRRVAETVMRKALLPLLSK